MKEQKTLLKSIRLGAVVLLGLFVYGYAFYTSDVNLETIKDETRLTQLTRILRALAHPNIIEYEQEVMDVEIPFYLPCPEDGAPAYEPDTSGPYLVIESICGDPGEILQIEGHNFMPNAKGPINFIPLSGVKLQIDEENLSTDSKGYFSTKIKLPNRQPVDEAQIIRATARRNIGTPRFTQMTKVTWDKIVETILMALLATTFGIFIAIPISFLAARNLMVEVKSSLASISLSLIGWPIGLLLGGLAALEIQSISASFMGSMSVVLPGVIFSPVIIWFAARWAIQQGEIKTPSTGIKIARGFVLFIAGIIGIFFLFFLAKFFTTTSDYLSEAVTTLPFISNFIFIIGDIIQLFTPVIVALAVGGALGSFCGGLGQTFSDSMEANKVKLGNVILAAIAGAVLFVLISAGINWIYRLTDLTKTWYWPAGIGAVAGIALASFKPAKETLPTGSVIYFITRTILNVTRSVEPLVMVIVFVVWVSMGPFAGALALGLHTIAALAKLFSEQVESILPGPLEAIRATGANRLQTIVYAVVPQIVPPYISFTMYRWDINVRMSTIIGFAGGGGIGFLLQQNIGLVHYRDASVQMVAIAITVATMDYISSVMRERFV